MINRRHIATLIAAATAMAAAAQTDIGRIKQLDEKRQWTYTDIAAGMSADTLPNYGKTWFNINHEDGTFHRVQEGNQTNSLTFFAERYQKLGNYLYGYGKFQFDHGRTKERAWCDEERPYNSNPFISGSSIKGKYDFQYFDLTAAISTIPLWGVRAGARIDYKTGDLSRLRDPRSRSQLLQYKLTPSLTYTYFNHTFALSGYYERRKEKIPNINTVQSDATIKYYMMSGMENAEGTTSGYSGFMRQWVSHKFGATLAWGIKTPTLGQLTTLTIARTKENIQGTYKYEPGKYYEYEYGGASQTVIHKGSNIHRIDLAAKYQQAYADEYRQTLVQTNDSATGLTSYNYETTLNFKKRYQVNLFNASLHYRWSHTDGNKVKAYAGAAANYGTAKNKHLLPESQLKYGRLNMTAEGGCAFIKGKLWAEAAATYSVSTKSDIALSDENTEYAQSVLLPDMEYYKANYWKGTLSVTYQIPINIKKIRTLWFVKLYGNYLSTDNSLNNKEIGLTIGLLN